MLFWFVATSVWSVWFVFRDPHFDYRLLAIASLIPDIIDAPFGGARAFHGITVSIAILFGIMLVTIDRRPIRRHLLAIPIGMFMHLVFDPAFANSKTFWWPFTGVNFGDVPLPSVERGMFNVVLEIVGVIGCVVAWRHFSLSDPIRRGAFIARGELRHTS